MIEGGVNDCIHIGRSGAQAIQVFQIAAMHLGAGGDKRLCARIRTRKPEHLMA